ncbi:hypothetical protein MMC27_006405 [Xylographa pallens]|nr:hypothetical protein [Xylographa pallens]
MAAALLAEAAALNGGVVDVTNLDVGEPHAPGYRVRGQQYPPSTARSSPNITETGGAERGGGRREEKRCWGGVNVDMDICSGGWMAPLVKGGLRLGCAAGEGGEHSGGTERRGMWLLVVGAGFGEKRERWGGAVVLWIWGRSGWL